MARIERTDKKKVAMDMAKIWFLYSFLVSFTLVATKRIKIIYINGKEPIAMVDLKRLVKSVVNSGN